MNGADAIRIVVSHLDAAGKTIDHDKRSGIGRYAKRLIEEHQASPRELERWAHHYGKRLAAGARIRPSQAWEDVIGSEDGGGYGHNGTSKQAAARRRISQMAEVGLISQEEASELFEQVGGEKEGD